MLLRLPPLLLQAVDKFHMKAWSFKIPVGAQLKHRDMKPGCCLHALQHPGHP